MWKRVQSFEKLIFFGLQRRDKVDRKDVANMPAKISGFDRLPIVGYAVDDTTSPARSALLMLNDLYYYAGLK
ncbi:hypothetical protein [Candidatus Endomicrobiellum agilis]|jgi:hypothetical protein|uniref:hypothetical protein n=1 Tax=Candidatus Endomicrobiellum agilis TaxID=3238957 RepID=UPI003586DCAD|nr:hypothetical protein [Endomicrobium sp.]